jgi:hypothetical protein
VDFETLVEEIFVRAVFISLDEWVRVGGSVLDGVIVCLAIDQATLQRLQNLG